MLQITFIDADGTTHALQVEPGQTVMQAAIENDIRGILADCGGSRSCATCHCYVDPAWAERFPPASVEETELVSYAFDPLPTSRLSCQLPLQPEHDGLVIRLPPRQI
ncbi:MAG: 2Fe-2S iron-sulfur cluster-binding protein [Rhodoferax sp.]|jgi:2Fe-2S ferredoxin|nr:2Fe-2S iron-sulfur cluster binding domain-containing protein [Rhodoferax sp.]